MAIDDPLAFLARDFRNLEPWLALDRAPEAELRVIHTLFFRSGEASDRFEREQTGPGCWRSTRQQMAWDDGDPFEWWLELTEPVPFVFDAIRTRVARMVETAIAAGGVYNGFLLYFEQPGLAEVVDPSTLGR